jgi:poly(3-hydroxybutyrate) depolymerase
VRPQDIRGTRLLTVEGELDDISGSGQTQAAHDLCSGIGRRPGDHLEVKGAGHYGIFSGRRWREQVYPLVRDFIAESGRLAAQRAPERAVVDQAQVAAQNQKPHKPVARKAARGAAVRRRA